MVIVLRVIPKLNALIQTVANVELLTDIPVEMDVCHKMMTGVLRTYVEHCLHVDLSAGEVSTVTWT